MNLSIAPLESADLEFLHLFQPPEWNDIRPVFRSHFGQAYFHAVKVILDDEMIGVSELFLNVDSAWLGNIIIRSDLQRKGIGKFMTEYLIQTAQNRDKKLQLLLATQEGKGLYAKLGFEYESEYHFFRKESNISAIDFFNKCILLNNNQFDRKIIELDALATGEDRSAILKRFTSDAWVFTSQDEIEGFYLPRLGDGLIIAKTEAAGLSLLQFRQEKARNFVVIPQENIIACNFLKDQGYEMYRRAVLMRLGPMKTWNPQMIYSRIGGYLG
ncbi:MAG: GNAT family N-acetyltransferase [Saprospiraceae bacterium]|nr:GNAT family N-acetyltransferase [Saprospiraceae bacterium]